MNTKLMDAKVKEKGKGHNRHIVVDILVKLLLV